MPYIPQEQRPFWDSIINQFLDLILNQPGCPVPSKSQLNYSLSRIVWAIFNRYPTYSVGSDLCAVLTDVRDEFKRRKLSPLEDSKIIENGDLPEGPQPVGTITAKAQSAENVNIQQVPKLDTNKTKVIKLSDLKSQLEKGMTMQEAIDSIPGDFVQHNDPKYHEKCAEAIQKSLSPAPLGGPPPKKPKVELSVIDPDAEKNAEAAMLRSLKAFAIAKQSNASPETMRRLHENSLDRIAEYMKVLGVKS